MMMSVRFFIVMLSAALVTPILHGQNLLTNSDFDSDVVGWITASQATVV